jgi:site-specific recombinase XerD
MKKDLVRIAKSEIVESLDSVEDRAASLAFASMSANTKKAYKVDIAQYSTWCKAHDVCPFPAEPKYVRLYIASMSETASSSKINRALSAIDKINQHLGAGKTRSDFSVSSVMSGIRRSDTRKPNKVPAATSDKLLLLVGAAKNSGVSRSRITRDVAILLACTWGALRASEVSDLMLSNLEICKDGESVTRIVLTIAKSKTDQEGKGETVILPRTNTDLCPVSAILEWLSVRGYTEGSLFLRISGDSISESKISAEAISAVFSKYSNMADLPRLTGHSGRAGFITEAANAGMPLHKIQEQSRHSSINVLMGYIRTANKGEGLDSLFKPNK